MDSVDVFEDALYTVFSHHQPARGDPGSHARYENARLPAWCADETGARYVGYAIASPGGESTRLFAHHQWDAGVYLADLVAEGALLDVRSRTVVELGAGTGLPSLVAAAVGAAEVRGRFDAGRGDGLSRCSDFSEPTEQCGRAARAACRCVCSCRGPGVG